MKDPIPFTASDVSLVIPVRNRTEQLRRAIGSVMSGSRTPHQLIVVDDCSSDDVTMAIHEWRNEVIYCRLNSKVGAAAARNIGASMTHGRLVAFLDSDGEWLPTKLEQQLRRLNETGADACYCSVSSHVGGREQPLKATFEGNLLKPLLRSGNIVGGGFSSLLIKRELFERVKGVDDSLRARQDYDLHLRVSLAGGSYCRSPELGVRFQLSDIDRIEQSERARICGILQCFRKHRDLFLRDRRSRWPSDLSEATCRLIRIKKYMAANKVLQMMLYLLATRGNFNASSLPQLTRAIFCAARKRDSCAAGTNRGVRMRKSSGRKKRHTRRRNRPVAGSRETLEQPKVLEPLPTAGPSDSKSVST